MRAKKGSSTFAVIDLNTKERIAGYDSSEKILVKAKDEGIYIANGGILVHLDMEEFQEQEIAYTPNANIISFSVAEDSVLAAADDHSFSFYGGGGLRLSTNQTEWPGDFTLLGKEFAVLGNRNEHTLRLLQKEDHQEEIIFTYDPYYPHDEARITPDGKQVILYSYHDFRIYGQEGVLITEVKIPNPETVYDQQYLRQGEDAWLEVIWYDGTKRCYSSVDGSLIQEIQIEPPNQGLEEEFFTNRYRIVSLLHEAAKVYEKESGSQVAYWEEDAYLTYVTEAGEYILAEYIGTTGERYGFLLNQKLEKLAFLPNLCDWWENQFIFDDQAGNLRKSRLYSLQELVTLGDQYIYFQQTKEE